jgi:23S rRNA pseudouridine1911/1915/1917 synthase
MTEQKDLYEIVADAADAGTRLDRVLQRHVPGLSRARLQALIRDGHLTCDAAPLIDPGQKVKSGAALRLIVPPPIDATPRAEAIALSIVYEDRDLIVIDKPAGLVVHPGAGQETGTLVNALLAHCGDSLSGIGGVRRPGIVHRLDKETSGLLVVAKTDAAHAGLSEQFAAHGRDGRLERQYRAIVWGAPVPPIGTIDAAIARSTTARTKMAVTRAERAGARAAVTRYATLMTARDTKGAAVASLLSLTLETGRTHQIRVHLTHAGHPLLGDPAYGSSHKTRAGKLPAAAKDALERLGRQALHAAVLGFDHPRTGRAIRFESAVPPDLAALAAALGLEAGTGRPRPATVAKANRRPRRAPIC